MPKVNVLGVQIDAITLDQVLAFILDAVRSARHAQIVNVHVMALNIAYEQPWFREVLNAADLAYCDGMGVKLGSQVLGAPLPQRLTLADWMPDLASFAQANWLSLYFLGNPPGSAAKAAEKLRQAYPGLRIVGEQHGYFDKSPGGAENEAVLRHILAAHPDVLLVGFGAPAQEKWLMENFHRLDVPVAITCGAIFEYVAGELQRGPGWLTQNYLEWLARLVISPRRYARRYLRDNPLFLARIIRQRLTGFTPES